MAYTIQQVLDTNGIQTLMSSELNSLATATKAIAASAYDNTSTLNLLGDFELAVTYGSNPTAGTTVDLYLIPSLDGTHYADGDASTAPAVDQLVGSFKLRATTSAQRMVVPRVALPPFKFKALVLNNAGQTTASSGNTLKMYAYNEKVG